MKKFKSYIIIGVVAACSIKSQAQINSMKRNTTAQQQNTTIQQQPLKTIQVSQTGTSTNVRQVTQMKNMVPVPKKILLFSRHANLALVSENASSTNAFKAVVAKGPGNVSSQVNGNERRVTSGILGLTTKNFNGGPKAKFALTSNISSWPSVPSYAIKTKAEANDNSDPSWNCTVTNETVTAQSTSFMNASKNEQGVHLYPGAIYSYDDYASGNFKAFENGMNPIDLYTNTQVGVNSFTVPNPTAPSIRQAISNIVGQFSPMQGGATILQQTLYSDNLTDLSIAISAGGAYDGYSASDSYNHNQSEHHIYITLDAIKSLYTISVHRPSNGYFANGQIPQTSSPLVMVQDVTYGARLLANIDITISSKTDMNKFQFAYNAIAANGFANIDALAHDASITYKINAYMVGVPTSVGIITTLTNFQQQLNTIFSQSNYRNAVPIQYSLTDLDGNYLGIESMTDQFTVRNCTPAQEVFTLQNMFAVIQTGNDGKNDDSEFDLYLFAGQHLGVAQYTDHTTEFTNRNIATLPLNFFPRNDQADQKFTLTDFKDGGIIAIKFYVGIGVFHATHDDWDITDLKLKLNFVSQKGTQYPVEINVPNFRLSSEHDMNFYFDGNFNLIK